MILQPQSWDEIGWQLRCLLVCFEDELHLSYISFDACYN